MTLKKPLSIVNGAKDIHLTPDNVQKVKDVFEQKEGKVPQTELAVYQDAGHGFAVRWNPESEREQRRGEEADEQTLKWFEKHPITKSDSECVY